jgi:hypothetical protein
MICKVNLQSIKVFSVSEILKPQGAAKDFRRKADLKFRTGVTTKEAVLLDMADWPSMHASQCSALAAITGVNPLGRNKAQRSAWRRSIQSHWVPRIHLSQEDGSSNERTRVREDSFCRFCWQISATNQTADTNQTLTTATTMGAPR